MSGGNLPPKDLIAIGGLVEIDREHVTAACENERTGETASVFGEDDLVGDVDETMKKGVGPHLKHADEIAERGLALDPFEIRRINMMRDGAVTHTKQTLGSVSIGKVLDMKDRLLGGKKDTTK